MIMKKIWSISIIVLASLDAFSQQQPVNDTLIPKQHRDDTMQYEPKLQGGALIDTVNIKDTSHYQPGYLKDTLERKSRKDKPKSVKD